MFVAALMLNVNRAAVFARLTRNLTGLQATFDGEGELELFLEATPSGMCSAGATCGRRAARTALRPRCLLRVRPGSRGVAADMADMYSVLRLPSWECELQTPQFRAAAEAVPERTGTATAT